MDALNVILTRRSVRKFTAQPVSDESIESILRAAMSAPSATNEQPWQFLVINQRGLLDKILTVHPYAAMCAEAAAAIIPCVDFTSEKYKDFWPQDMSAATQNILLAARALGLGAVWVGVYPNNERILGIQQLFNLPEQVTPFSIIPIGYSNVPQVEAKERFKKERIHYNEWRK